MEKKDKPKMIPLSWVLVVIAGFALAGTGILWMAGRTIRGHGAHLMDYHTTPLKKDSLRRLHLPSAVLSDREREALDAFERWVDSAQKDPTRRRVFDSLTRARPGLVDSMKEVREYIRLSEP